MNTINNCMKLFGLGPDAALDDVKKTYRKLAKRNHPDCFKDYEQKKKQEKIMVGINEAYQILLNNFNDLESEAFDSNKTDIEDDYTLYSKGLDYYKMCFENTYNRFERLEKQPVKERENNLIKARYYFDQLLTLYPNSDWANDALEKLNKLKNIEKTIENMNKTMQYYKNKTKR